MSFDAVAEQNDAKRLLTAALADGPAHAYLLHGPPGVGKRATAFLFAAELLGEHARVARHTHPDLYVLEPLGDQIRIDDIRALRRDLHMRPFEASHRVYLVFDADTRHPVGLDPRVAQLVERFVDLTGERAVRRVGVDEPRRVRAHAQRAHAGETRVVVVVVEETERREHRRRAGDHAHGDQPEHPAMLASALRNADGTRTLRQPRHTAARLGG